MSTEGADNIGYEETESIAVPAMTDYLSVGNNTAENVNSHTYVYEPNKSLHQMTLEAFPSENNYRNLGDVFTRPTIEQLIEGKTNEVKDAEKGDDEDKVPEGKVIKFGWVEGVFMRCLLNIWGTMLFLRLTWVVGQAGILQGLLIITLANVVTFLSALSMSAISTNGQIAAGGVYYMISRALGPTLGGSIGLMFFLANSISVATYTIGFAESLLDFLQDLVPGWDGITVPLEECAVAGCRNNDVRIIGAPVLCFFLFLAFAGMDWITRIQKALLMLLLLAQVDMFIGSFLDIEFGTAYVLKIDEDGYQQVDQGQRKAFGYTGWSIDTASDNFDANYQSSPIAQDPSFMECFGVFFTAVTGIVAGANLSGDLKDPGEAIPKGTLLAIGFTYVTYMYFAVQTGFVFGRQASGVREEFIYWDQIYQGNNSTWPEGDYPVKPCQPLQDYLTDNNLTWSPLLFPNHTYCEPESLVIRNLLKGCTKDANATAGTDNSISWYDENNQWLDPESCNYGSAQDQMTMTYVSFTGYLRYAGGFSASLSSAIASLVGAPRVLQAVGLDKIYPGVYWFAKGGNANNDPWRGYIFCFFISFGLCMIASLNEVSVIASNFFLAAYALMNLSVFHSSITKAPSWRPAFTWYNKWVSLFAALMCIALMFAMDWIYALVTVCFLGVLGVYILWRNPEANWGSSTQGQVFVNAVKQAQILTETPDHVKNYRPKVLLLSGNPAHRPPLVNFASLVTHSSSLLICGHIMPDDGTQVNIPSLKDNVQLWMKDHHVKGFYSALQSQTMSDGARSMMSLSGLGKLSPNMVMMGFKRDWMRNSAECRQYVDILFAGFRHNLSIGILRVKQGFDYSKIIASEEVVTQKKNEEAPKGALTVGLDEGFAEKKSRRVSVFRGHDGNFISSKHVAGIQMFTNKTYTGFIDVWWLYDDGGLTLLLPYILTLRKQYANCKLRVFGLSSSSSLGLDEEQKSLAQLLAKFRIVAADVVIIPDVTKKAESATRDEFTKMIEGQDIDQSELMEEKEKTNRHLRLAELLRQYSSESELIVITLPLVRRDRTNPALYMAWLDIMTKDLPPTLIMRGNQQSVLTFYN